ncbi:MAG: hypothetical protein GAK35_00790 [Herbaspirillum frisingense]|uniref:Lipoprotein n=1 Tax=Herbaspirillum frisingense TaxID=92645 RepID=A0A7V8FZC5_9BURK|nr:MAG: hypothetical protein GAK35_00790 [Herbaspirillum frisingense]
MKKKSLFMLALGSLAVMACARPALRKADELVRRRRGETLSGLPARLNEEDMQAVAQESSVVADGTQAHEPQRLTAAVQPLPPSGRKDGDFAPPVGA